ncbi:unnamed protein product, partial [marine sediment metagenome]
LGGPIPGANLGEKTTDQHGLDTAEMPIHNGT